MSILVADQLLDKFVQPIKVERPITLLGIRAKLYFHDRPAGNFSLSFYQNGNKLYSYPFTSMQAFEAIGATKSYYFWADLALKGICNLPEGDLELRLEATGYTFSSSSWLGWCKDFTGYEGKLLSTPTDFTDYPYMFTLVQYREREL